ncbi:class I SAM-dependent methyltransferase [Desertifilum sp. FACHB-1129]|uniref:Methyltransferase n=1 Tax=Desertifilum tharense IPPAS B-1220 TaxID=1781255 RepID=A0A1E5QK92_9CYAN|nr:MULTISPECIES: class I SAM-dependent methyltransferase [Desertifilum]MDA0211098.1 class I SAM-dependent methyltransferase [Cyanobacteria bacterium FC1]MBD2314166.1 class I SAM-dependent methyltransferase [Desertifilum sp. FACHB-1129]MBD2320131.1 class I SAM-dependent methyltransferase [Desertifilum sp. FACHB-866]MBD2330259.1 class I SAM-dependent methyltransferase [Desertifilum sp. FACHB-868]OEJ75109.1 methyltransferase [Desertifilum tharense IPPAS B-1220]
MTPSTLNLQTASAHQVMAAAGKKILRPGGKAATLQLCQWAQFQPGETVLELAASFGYSAIALAQQYGVRVVGVEKNPESVARARVNIQAAGLSDRVEVIEGDIFHLERIPGQFDCVLAEAILTMQSPLGKAKVLQGICDRLKPGGRFLSHELLARASQTEIHQALAAALRVNSTPLSEQEWIELCQTTGFEVVQRQTGAMELLNPTRIIQDEGWVDASKFFWNVLTQPGLRDRLFAIRRVFKQYERELGYLILSAERKSI